MDTLDLLTDKLLELGRSAIAALPRLTIAILVFAGIYGFARFVRHVARRLSTRWAARIGGARDRAARAVRHPHRRFFPPRRSCFRHFKSETWWRCSA